MKVTTVTQHRNLCDVLEKSEERVSYTYSPKGRITSEHAHIPILPGQPLFIPGLRQF
jgi:hypothetical protein